MNLHLKDVVCTSKEGDRFWRMPECYVRGNTIKYLRVADDVITKVEEESSRKQGALVVLISLEIVLLLSCVRMVMCLCHIAR